MIDHLLLQVREATWANQTTFHPLGLTLLIVMALTTIAAPRRYAVIPFFLMMCVVARQRLVIATVDFDFLRLMVVAGWLRITLRGELAGLRWKRIDTVYVLWAIAGFTAFTTLYKTGPAATLAAGTAFDAIGGYLLFRCLVRGWDDVLTLLRGMAVLAVPIAVFFFLEKTTGRNHFSVFGGVPEITVEREGRLRCQGAFVHPILAGAFWAALIPLFAALWYASARDRLFAVTGGVSALVIVYASASSTPIIGVAAGLFGLAMYALRAYMKPILWSVAGLAVFLHFAMNKPIWHLISRIDIVGGSTGYHRYRLLDAFFKNTSEWFLFGTKSTAHWGHWLHDITNQYILQGVRGGFFTMALFLAVTVLAYRGLGRLGRRFPDRSRPQRVAWCLGASLFAHMVMFIAVSYFGQITMLWCLTLAIIGSMTPLPAARRAPARARQPRPRPATA